MAVPKYPKGQVVNIPKRMPLSVVEHRQRPEQRFSPEKNLSTVSQVCTRSQALRRKFTCQFPDERAPLTSSDLRDNRRFGVPVPPYTRGFEDACYEHAYTNPYKPGTLAAGDYRDGFEDGRRTLGESAP